MAVAKAFTSDNLPEGEELDVELPDVPEGTTSEETPDGGIVITFGAEVTELSPDEAGHAENLVEFMDDGDIAVLVSELQSQYDADRRSRSDWERAYVKGLEFLGTRFEDRTQPWEGACGVYHPILSEAAMRFQANAIMEIFPSGGPVMTEIIGKLTPEKAAQAARVETDMNYLTTEVMTEYRAETERLLFNLALAGCAARKVYFDPVMKRPAALFVPAEDFVVSYGASDLSSCTRYTQVLRLPKNEIRKLQVAGLYADVDLPDPTPERSDLDDAKDRTELEVRTWEYDDRLTLLEMHVDLDLPGFESDDGVALPYVVTFIKDSGDILSIRRNWNEEDETKKKIIHFAIYNYLPGMGFYGFGLIHLIGGIAKSATGILRQLVDAGTVSNLPGGLKSRGLRIKGDDSPIQPGEFRDVDVPGGSIRDNITFLPYKEPSSVLYSLLGTIVEEGRRFASISEMNVGDMKQDAPVGTTLALLERNQKVMSAVQARLHASMKVEFRLLAGIVKDYLDPKYPYEVEGDGDRTKDYSDVVDVLPVSDPNSTTMAQRIMQYQAALQLAQNQPQIYDMPALHRKMIYTLGIKDAESIIPDKNNMKPTDPVTENMALLNGKPVKAFLTQDHEAHIAVHTSMIQDPKIGQLVGQSPTAPIISAALSAHLQEHIAFAYRKSIEDQLGVPLPSPADVLPEDVEIQLSPLLAQAAQRVLQGSQAQAAQQQAQQAAQDPVVQMQQADIQIRQQEVQRKAQKDQTEAQIATAMMQQDAALEREKIAAQERIAGARVGMEIGRSHGDLAIRDKQISSTERTAGANIGVQIAKDNNGSVGPASPPPTRPPK
jgi:hypothetical protein